ncbi:MAG: dephospho-CoA kinase [Chitinophagaceae bacterium]
MIKIGITGGIGSGKSTVCQVFAALQIPIFYADEVAKNIYQTSNKVKEALIEHFGEQMYDKNGVFQRDLLRSIVFNNNEELQWINQLIHPIVKEEGNLWFKNQQSPYAIKEAALLIESGSYQDMDFVILVLSPIELRMKRILHRDPFLKTSDIEQRMAMQFSDERKETYADFLIHNDEKKALIPQVIFLHQQIMERCTNL